jgi:Signal transduction histidine kinase
MLIHLEALAGQGFAVKTGEKAAFKVLSIRDGLPNASVSALAQDSKGFIWMATQGGLARYDGSGFKVYANEPFDTSTISSNQLQTLFLDKDDSLWIGSYNGLNHLRSARDGGIKVYRAEANKPNSLSNDLIITIARDARGRLWVGTLNGLNCLDERTGGFKRYFNDPANPYSLPNNTVRSLFLDRSGRLWVGTTGGGFASYDYEHDLFNNYAQAAGTGTSTMRDAPGMAPTTSIQAITQDSSGALWLGAWGSGLLRFVPERREWSAFALPDNRIYAVNAEDGRAICAGTWGGGLFILDPEAKKIDSYSTSSALGSLPNDVAYSILRDASGELWVGTNGGGVALMDRTRSSFSAYAADPKDPGALPTGKILSTIIDAQGRLWASVYAKGVHRYDEATGRWTHFRHADSDPSSLADDICNALYVGRDGTIWAATNDGLSRYLPERSAFSTLRHQDGDPAKSLSSNIVNTIFEDRSGGLWIGTYTTGLDHWDRASGAWTHYPYDPAAPSSLSDNLIYCMAYDARGRLWIGTNNGLDRFEGGSFARYMYDSSKRDGVSSNSIQKITLDSKGELWMGTRGGGVMHYDEKADSFSHYTHKDGLPNNIVYGILEDRSSNLWFVTQTGIARFDRETGHIKRVALYKELENASFSTGSSVGPDGELYFGSVGIIARFNPSLYEVNMHRPPVFLTSARASSKELLDSPVAEDKAGVTLAYNENSLEFSFAALDYRDSSANEFAYKLEGFDKGWTYSGRNYASYTNLPGGFYTFRVKAANNDGLWNEQGASIRIGVAYSPFISPPALILYLVIIASAGYALATLRSNRALALKLRELSMAQVALKAANEAARRHAQEAERATKAKSEFVSIVSHEVRTPTNGVIGMIDLLSRTKLDAKQLEYVETIRSSGQALLAVVNEVLDFSKIEADKIELESIAFDPRGLVDRIAAPFVYQARDKGIALEKEVSDDVPECILGDPLRVGQVMTNLISNAVKFTEKGTVRVELRVEYDAGSATLAIELRDTGIGIAADKLAKLFEPFAQASESTARLYGGSGLGLMICKKLITLMGGSLSATSEPGKGSSFVARMPLREAPASAIEPAQSMDSGGPCIGFTAPASVLVVDDDDVNRRVASYLFGELGISVEEAKSGQEAIELLKKEKPDIVLMDCHMPGMDGFEATRRIRSGEAGSLEPKATILAMTASADEAELKSAIAAGMDGSVAKPVTLASLIAALKSVDGRTGQAGRGRAAAPLAGGFDAGAFAARYAGDKGIGRQILQMFVAQSPQILAEAKAARLSRNAKALRDAVHRLKGTSGAIGGFSASRAAERVLSLVAQAAREAEEGVAADFAPIEAAIAAPMADFEAELDALIEAAKACLESGALD